ncbi:MAG: diguanylate cyclase, partial [Methylophilaceae bacterium]
PKAYFGHANDFLENIKLSWSEQHAKGLGPGGKAIRSGKAVVVEDMMLDPSYPVIDEALREGYRALVSLPLRHKNHTFGLLGLYSSKVRSFSEGELSLLQELTDNLAAGIINIRAEHERQQLHDAMLMVANAVSQNTGQTFFPKLLSNVIEALGAQAGYIAQFITQKPWKARTVAVQVDGEAVENFDYAIPDAVADTLFASADVRIERQHVARDYPNLVMLRFYPYQAFAALRLIDSSGNPIGLMFVLFKEPLSDYLHDVVSSMLKIFATRTSNELERLKDEAIIREQASLLEKTNDAIVVRDMEHRITFWNKGAQALYGWTSAEALGQPINKLLQHSPAVFRRAVNTVLKSGQWNGEVAERHKNGELLIIESHWTLVKDERGQPKSIFAIKTDISDRKLAEEQIKQLAFYDPLTKLPNRRLLMDRLEKALSATRRKKLFGALIFIDLDNFKMLNDTLGHDKGDLLLQEVATRLKRCVRDCDTVARLGGDEFVMMVEDLNSVQAPAIALARIIGQKILNELNHTFDFDGYQHLSTPSIGIALFNHHTKDVDELIKQADTAMYKSKSAGRNRLTFYQ